MSLILDALNRADRERGNQQSPARGVGSTQASGPGALPLRRWALEALVVVAVLVVIYQQSRPATEPATAVAIAPITQSTEPNTASREPAAVRPVPAEQQSIAGLPPAGTGPLNATLDIAAIAPMQSNSANTLATAVTATGPDPEADSVPTAVSNTAPSKVAINALYQQTAPPTPVAPVAPIVPAAPALPAPQPAAISPQAASDRSLAILNSIPLLAQMPRRLQRAVPTINYTLHIYAQAGGLVELNGQRLKTGAQLSPQLRVTAILKDSLVLEFEGVQFRLAALNSWMNFN